MSALIDESNGRANMAFVGETPWHGLGAQMEAGRSIDEWIVAAGLGFDVLRAPTAFEHNGVYMPIENKVALVRGDTLAPVGFVSNRYKEVQPREALEFFRQYAEAGGVEIETAGSLAGGARIWGMARMPQEIKVAGDDVVLPYLLFNTSYDGTSATEVQATSVRVVCNNTLGMAREGRLESNSITISHRNVFNREDAQKGIKDVLSGITEFAENAGKLSEIGVNDEQAIAYFTRLVGKLNEDRVLTTQSKNKIERLLVLYKQGPGAELKSASGTAWGLLNAVTRYQDFESGQRKPGTRLESSWFGAGNVLKLRAQERALQLAV